MKAVATLICSTFVLSLHAIQAAGTFEVRAFGAKGDGTNYDTEAIQKALDACSKAEGTVHFSDGTYLSKPLVVGTKTTVHLDQGATLLASPVQADFLKTGTNWLKAKSGGDFNSFITGKKLEDVVIEGPGTIDGNGAMWWDEAEKARRKVSGFTLPRPNLIVLTGVKNLLVHDITLKNSPKFHLVPTDCDGVVISNTTILAPEHSANTDAIDPSACKNVLITKCTIDVGDDNVAIKAGRKMEGREFACENILVSDCTFLHGHGMSIGSETGGGVHNVVVTNCTFENTENGIRIKSQRGKGGLVEDIHYSHLTMTNVDPAITFTSYYQNNSAKDSTGDKPTTDTPPPAPVEGTPVYRNIYITDLTATCQRGAGTMVGLPECCISNVVLKNVSITSAKGFSISNAKGIQLKNVIVKPLNGDPFILVNAQVEGLPSEQK